MIPRRPPEIEPIYLINPYGDERIPKDEKGRIAEPVRTKPKVGRNEPCPCGSGIKYKKCYCHQ